MRRYFSLLTDRRALAVLLAGTIARLATQSMTIPLIFTGTQNGYEFEQTGSMVGSYAIGRCIAAPIIGRIADRHGMGTTVAVTGIVHLACIAAVAGVLAAGAPSLLAALFSLIAGLAFPPASAAVRAVLAVLYADSAERSRAFALDSISLQIALIAGPLIGGAVSAAIGGCIALLFAALLLMASCCVFRGSIDIPRSRQNAGSQSLLRLRSFVAVLGVTFFLAFSLGCFDIAIPASLSANGDLALTGIAFSVMAFCGMVGTSVWSAFALIRHAGKRLLLLLATLAVSVALFGFCSASSVIIVVWALAGLSLGPAYATLYQLTGESAPDEQKTEAFSWLVTAGMLGNGIGAWIAGWGSKQYPPSIVLFYSGSGCFLACLIGSYFFLKPGGATAKVRTN